MHAVLVVVGLSLAFIGYTVERQPPMRFTRGKAVGLVLFLIGVILLFGEGWWWGLMGLLIPPLLIEFLLFATRPP